METGKKHHAVFTDINMTKPFISLVLNWFEISLFHDMIEVQANNLWPWVLEILHHLIDLLKIVLKSENMSPKHFTSWWLLPKMWLMLA